VSSRSAILENEQPRPQGLLAFQYSGGREDPNTDLLPGCPIIMLSTRRLRVVPHLSSGISKASETRARGKITPREKRRHSFGIKTRRRFRNSGACAHNFLNVLNPPASHHPQNNFLFFIHQAYLIAFVRVSVRSGYQLPQLQRFKDYAPEIFGQRFHASPEGLTCN